MEGFTEEYLIKLSVKELKLIARKSNVNPNSKKAELVRALLTSSVNDTVARHDSSEIQTSRRMTRSRGSIWPASNGTTVSIKESKGKLKDEGENLHSEANYSDNVKKIKKKDLRSEENINIYDTSEMFPLVSSIQLATKPLLEITNKDISSSGQNKDQESSSDVASKRLKRSKKNIEVVLPTTTGDDRVTAPVNPCIIDESTGSHKKESVFNGTFVVGGQANAAEEVNVKKRKKCKIEVSSKDQHLHSSGESDKELMSINVNTETTNLMDEIKSEPMKPKRARKQKRESLEIRNSNSCHDVTEHDNSAISHLSKDSLGSKTTQEGSGNRSETLKRDRQYSSKIVSKLSNTTRMKCNAGNEQNLSSAFEQLNKNSPVVKSSILTDEDLSETFDNKIVEVKTVSILNESKNCHGDVKKRKRRGSPSTEHTNNVSESKFSQINQNNPKRKKVSQRDADLSTEIGIDDKPKSRSIRNKKEELSPKCETSKSQELKEIMKTSSNNFSDLNRYSRQNESTTNFLTEPAVKDGVLNDSMRKSLTMDKSTTIQNNDEQNSSTVKGQTGQKSKQVPIRSSTFILSDLGAAEHIDDMPVPAPLRDATFILSDTGAAEHIDDMPVPALLRDATFILSDTDGLSPQRKSLRFSSGAAAMKKNIASKPNVDKLGKSIGNRIMQSLMVKKDERSAKKEPGSVLKKNIMKSATPGSIMKKRSAIKMPNFKKIHEQLFNNMESLSENKKRQFDRAQCLLQSPAVPRCALLSPKPTDEANSKGSTVMKRASPRTSVASPRTSAASPRTLAASRTLVATPSTSIAPQRTSIVPSRTSIAPSPLASKLKTPLLSRTPVVSRKPAPIASSVNRFGFRKQVKKEEATRIIEKKVPLVNMEKKKEVERNVLKGVRMNKRFMLQMQMRKVVKDK